MNLQLANKTALITSASKGIGKGIAKALAQESCNIIITSNNPDNLAATAKELARDCNTEVATHLLDARDPDKVERAIDIIFDAHPEIDVLITNAPGPDVHPAAELGIEKLNTAVQTNVGSVVQLCRRCLPGMRNRGFGRIINIGSSTGREPDPNMALSNLTRAAVMAYAKTLSREVAKEGITVNTILTGGVLSERTVSLLEDDAKAAGKDIEIFLKEVGEQVFPVGYIATPEQFAPIIAFLASPLSGFINGVNLPVDGGLMRAL